MYQQIDLSSLPRALRQGLTPIMVAHTALMDSAALHAVIEDVMAIARVNEAKAQVLEHPEAVSGYCPGVPSLPAIAWMRKPPPRGTNAAIANDLADALRMGIETLRRSSEDPEGHLAVIEWIQTDLAQLCHRAFCFNTTQRVAPPSAASQPRLRLVR